MSVLAFVRVYKRENAVSRTCWHTHQSRERVADSWASNLQGEYGSTKGSGARPHPASLRFETTVLRSSRIPGTSREIFYRKKSRAGNSYGSFRRFLLRNFESPLDQRKWVETGPFFELRSSVPNVFLVRRFNPTSTSLRTTFSPSLKQVLWSRGSKKSSFFFPFS